MAEAQYSNREIREFFSDIKDTLSRIENQTTRTNGRVTKLEMRNSYIAGAIAVISIIALPLFSYMFFQLQDAQASIVQLQVTEGISTSKVSDK